MSANMMELVTPFNEYDEASTLDTLRQLLNSGVNPVDILAFLSKQLTEIGRLFSEGELFLPDMILAGDLMGLCVDELEPALTACNADVPKTAKVLLGSVKGDVHDIGKNMVKTMLSVSGFEVIDLGVDVSMEQFYSSTLSEKPDIVAMSSCMTTTIPSMKDTIDMLHERGLDERIKIVVGGGSMNESVASTLGNCTYGGRDAFEAVEICRRVTKLES